jgi:glycopeptide antibiotics resistance protein
MKLNALGIVLGCMIYFTIYLGSNKDDLNPCA